MKPLPENGDVIITIKDKLRVAWEPLVRCKDCRWHEQEQPGIVYCPAVVGGWVEEDWFCAGGVRKDGVLTMSEKQEHRKRYNLRLQYIAEFNKWLDREPPICRYRKWRKWKSERPVWRYIEFGVPIYLGEKNLNCREKMNGRQE